jgi:glycosyltransferase involved in cell wall biosynthesis
MKDQSSLRVLFYVGYPLAWAQGGHATQITMTKQALERVGINIHWLRHEEDTIPAGDIIHYWGRPPSDQHFRLARRAGYKLVISDMLPTTSGVSKVGRFFRHQAALLMRHILGEGLYSNLGMQIYQECDAAILLNNEDLEYLIEVWRLPPDRGYIVQNGVEDTFFDQEITPIHFDGLVSLGYICDVKNSLEVAMAARKAGVPIKFIGGTRVEDMEYEDRFRQLIDNNLTHWVGKVESKEAVAAHLKGARGLVLASKYEAQGLAALEALACKKPVLLSDLRNLRGFYGNSVMYSHQPSNPLFIRELQQFLAVSEGWDRPSFPVLTWQQVAERIANIYRGIM